MSTPQPEITGRTESREAAAERGPRPSFPKRAAGVFFDPRPTFGAVARRPIWVDAFLVVIVAMIIFTVVVTPYTRKDQVSMFEGSAKLRERLGEERFQAQLQRIQAGGFNLMQQVVGPGVFTGILLFVGSLFLLILGRLVSTQGTFFQAMAIFVHASLIDKVLGNAVRAVLIIGRKSAMSVSTGLALLFPKLEVTNPLYLALAQVDVFQLWMFGVLAYGIAAVFQIEMKKALFVSYGFWLLRAVVNFAIASVGMSFLR